MEQYLQDAWFFGIRTGHGVMLETRLGQTDATPVIHGMQGEFQELMERLAEDLNTTVGTTLPPGTTSTRRGVPERSSAKSRSRRG